MAAVGVLLVVSFGDLGSLLTALLVPLLNAERVSSRFVVVPLVFGFVLAARWLDGATARRRGLVGIAWCAAAVLMVQDLSQHSRLWATPMFAEEAAAAAIVRHRIVAGDDGWYEAAVYAGFAISAIAVAGVAVCALAASRDRRLAARAG